jgi:hypothetical protein
MIRPARALFGILLMLAIGVSPTPKASRAPTSIT